jgi:hypothetical protein
MPTFYWTHRLEVWLRHATECPYEGLYLTVCGDYALRESDGLHPNEYRCDVD